jgi:mannose-6-phosphate isomerase-like protein (cupin superfamily)
MRTRYDEQPAYETKDGSEIRELMHPGVHGNRAQSLAEARVQPGRETLLHRHGRSEELYHVTAGKGRMTLGEQTFTIAVGDTVAIPPGMAHKVRNTGSDVLVILCCCSPPYAHDDTELLDTAADPA